MRPYSYQELQYDESDRLLILHSSLHNSDPIGCTIQHVRVSDADVKYEAVSYTWGNTTATQTINFRDRKRQLHITKNCYKALRHLRCRYRDRLLWIDVICINQNSLSERASQVRLMDKIHSHASEVLVILREPSANNRIVFDELEVDTVLLCEGHCIRDPPNDVIVRLLQEDFFLDPWFERVWVLQGVCAKSYVRFICGSTSFDFDGLRELYFGYQCGIAVTAERWPLALEWIFWPLKESSNHNLTYGTD